MNNEYNEEEKRNWLVPDHGPGDDIQLGFSQTQEMARSPPASNTRSSVEIFVPTRRYVPGAQWIVRCVLEDQYDMDDVAILAFEFVRYDYRSIGHDEIHKSVWVYYFVGEYMRVVHNFSAQQYVDDYWGHFLDKTEVQTIRMWSELHEIGITMSNWVKTQRGWKRPKKLGGYFKAAWWSLFEETHLMNETHPQPPTETLHRFPHEPTIIGKSGTGHDSEDIPFGLPALIDASATEFST